MNAPITPNPTYTLCAISLIYLAMIEITVFGRVLFSINVTFSAYHLVLSLVY